MNGSFINPAATGFALSAGLIIAIGAQNAFVLRHGLRRRHVFAVAARRDTAGNLGRDRRDR